MEKYGTIPKRFTKAWWEYFWDYYKLPTIVVLFVILSAVITVYQCLNKVDYDFTLTFAGNITIPREKEQPLTDKLVGIIDDADGDGEKNVSLQMLTVTGDVVDPEFSLAMSTNLSLEFASGNGSLFIFSKYTLDSYLNTDGYEMFMPVEEWAEVMPDRSRLALAQGVPYAVKLSDTALEEDLGINLDDCYLLMRLQRNDEKEDAASNTRFQSSKKAANLLIR